VNSFAVVEPEVAVHSGEFGGWTHADMHVACFGSDDVERVSRHFFNNAGGAVRLRRYVSLYDQAGGAFLEIGNGVGEQGDVGERMVVIVKDWCGAVDPLTYVIMMKRRIDAMAAKIVRLQNTVDVWKAEVRDKEQKVSELARKVKFLGNKKK
jgi:hypothetical protein